MQSKTVAHALMIILMILHCSWITHCIRPLDILIEHLTQMCFLCKLLQNHCWKYNVPSKCHLSTYTSLPTSLTLLVLVHLDINLSHKDEAFSVYVPRLPLSGLITSKDLYSAAEKQSDSTTERAWHYLKVPIGIRLRGNESKMIQLHLVLCCSSS